jgi:hypothetical protein
MLTDFHQPWKQRLCQKPRVFQLVFQEKRVLDAVQHVHIPHDLDDFGDDRVDRIAFLGKNERNSSA